MNNIVNIILILIGFFVIYIVLKKDIEKLINQNKSLDQQNLLELSNKLIESFNILKQELSQHLQLADEKQTKIIETTSKVEEIARNLSSQTEEIKTFKEILSGPKTRGYFGEIMLKEILKNLPSSFYEEQYSFGLGLEKVDYVLKLNDTLIPIDAKFPVQNFQKIFSAEEKEKNIIKRELIKNIKSKIEDIAKKYIKNGVEFALMYLANEAIYYELLSDKDYEEVWDFAREKNVFITSPKTFELICSSLLLIIRKQEFSQNIQQILANIRQMEKDLLELNEQFSKSYTQLNNSFNNLREFEKTLNRFMVNFRSLIQIEKKLEKEVKEKSLV